MARQSRLNHMKSRLLNVPESDLSVSRLDTYHPPIPVSSTDDTLNMIIDGYRLFDLVVKGDPKPLPGQKIQTAGPNRVCPPNERSARLEAPSMPTMQQEMTHFGNVVSNQVDAYANMMANPMQMMRRQQPPPGATDVSSPADATAADAAAADAAASAGATDVSFPADATAADAAAATAHRDAIHDASDAERQPDAGADAGASGSRREESDVGVIEALVIASHVRVARGRPRIVRERHDCLRYSTSRILVEPRSLTSSAHLAQTRRDFPPRQPAPRRRRAVEGLVDDVSCPPPRVVYLGIDPTSEEHVVPQNLADGAVHEHVVQVARQRESIAFAGTRATVF